MYHFSNISDPVASQIKRNIYVDNVQNTFTNEADVMNSYVESKAIMNDAAFLLREWNSNSHCLKDLTKANNYFSKDGNITKILRLKLDAQTDVLSLRLGIFNCESSTERNIVSEIC